MARNPHQAGAGTIRSRLPASLGSAVWKPRNSYFICTVPRTGSWLLAQGLASTGKAGTPEEYFRPDYGMRYRELWGISNEASFEEYLAGVLTAAATGNGMFGAKIHWNQFLHLLSNLRGKTGEDWPASAAAIANWFPNLRYVWLRRRHKARQAISYLKAIQTNRWWVVRGEEECSQSVTARFDFEAISRLERMLTEQEACWAQYFEACGARPHTVFYEDLVRSYRSTVLAVLRYLCIPEAEEVCLDCPPLVRQADETSEQWLKLYENRKRS